MAGIRALLVVSDEKRRVRRLELRNEDEKTVARLELDEPAAASTHPAEVTVHALRGYEDQARRATRLLTALGLRPVADVDDREPDDASSTADTDRGAPATGLIAMELGEFLAAMRDNLPGLLDDVDTEFLHDFRVAVRRTRSTLKLGRPALPAVMQQPLGAGLQVARRPDDTGARPGRLRAGPAHDGGLAGGGGRQTTWSRSPHTCGAGGRPSGGHWCAG